MTVIDDTGDMVAAQKRLLAAKNLQRLIHIEEEQQGLETIVASLDQTVIDAHGNNPVDICDMMAVQTHMLDALFYDYLDRSAKPNYRDEHVDRAIRAQNQMLRTALAWKRLKTDTYLKHKIIKYFPPEKNPHETK